MLKFYLYLKRILMLLLVSGSLTALAQGIGLQNGPNIPAKAGTYFVTINALTDEYYFLK